MGTSAIRLITSYLTERKQSKLAIVRSFIASHFKYGPLIWHFCTKHNTSKLEKILRRSLRLAMDDFDSSFSDLLAKAGMTSLETGRQRTLVTEIYKALNHQNGPKFIKHIFLKGYDM